MTEIVRNFGVDWRLLIAQVVNFTILFFLLKRFAYQPVLSLLRQRTQKIEEGFAMRKEAEKTLGEIENIKLETAKAADEEALTIVKNAEETAQLRRNEIVGEATRRGELLVAEAKKNANVEAEKIQTDVLTSAEHLVREGIARVLRQLPPDVRDRNLIAETLLAIKAENKL